nr:hypothetical protein [Tanacetum cinerariifolium]
MLKHIFKGRLLASFLDREHEGGDTRSQGGIKDNVSKIKTQDHNMQMISQMNSQEQGFKSKRLSIHKFSRRMKNDSVKLEDNDLNLFTLKVNHGGVFTYVYGPKRTKAPRRVYKGGNADWFDGVDANGFSVLEVSGMVKELGYENPQMKFYYTKPTADLDKGLEPLSKDIDVLDMLSYVNKYKLMEMFIVHPLDNSVMDTIDLEQEDASAGLGDENVGNVANDLWDENVEEFEPMFSYLYMQTDNNEGIDHNEGSDNNEWSDHNKGSDNNEDKIDDVHVDMQMFKDNIDPNVEWVSSTEPEPQAENNENFVYEEVDLEDFDSEIDSDDDEAERRKSLRKLVRTRRELHLTRNDKKRVRAECRGIVPYFSNSGPNEDGLVDGPKLKERNLDITVKIDVERDYELDSMTRQFRRIYKRATATIVSYFNKNMKELKGANKELYDWLKLIPAQHWARSYFSARPHCDVLLNNMCEVLNRQLKDGRDKPIITCLKFIREYFMKRIVIVQQNGRNLYQAVGPKGDQCMVNVEERACSCKKFKINPCNGPDLWPPSDTPITYTSPEYHKPAGRPSKKRKKSDVELLNGLVKNGKLSCDLALCVVYKEKTKVPKAARKKKDKAEKALASAKQAAATSQLKAKEATNRYEKAKEVSEKDDSRLKRATKRYKNVWTVPAAAIPVVTATVSTVVADVQNEI